jgi:hypothetical protein
VREYEAGGMTDGCLGEFGLPLLSLLKQRSIRNTDVDLFKSDLTIELAELFDRLDTNKNGLLSKNELRNGLLAEGYASLFALRMKYAALFHAII